MHMCANLRIIGFELLHVLLYLTLQALSRISCDHDSSKHKTDALQLLYGFVCTTYYARKSQQVEVALWSTCG